MLGETHRKIGKFISDELNLGEREANLLINGSTNPDSWADFPHHHGKDYEIARNILEAQRQFSEGDDECYHTLGTALHYVQDKWTLHPRTGDAHTKWESQINQAPIIDDPNKIKMIIDASGFPTKVVKAFLAFLEKVSKGIDNSILPDFDDSYRGKYLAYEIDYFCELGLKTVVFATQERPTPWSTPSLDLSFAYLICLEIARHVFSQENDKEVWFDAAQLKRDKKIAITERERVRKEREQVYAMLEEKSWTRTRKMMKIAYGFLFSALFLFATSVACILAGLFSFAFALIFFGFICLILGTYLGVSA